MEDDVKIAKLTALTGETNTDILTTFLDFAKDKIMRKAYPLGNEPESMPSKYDNLQIEVAVYLLNKRGAEGETSHNENGVNRYYECGDVPASMLKNVAPHMKLI